MGEVMRVADLLSYSKSSCYRESRPQSGSFKCRSRSICASILYPYYSHSPGAGFPYRKNRGVQPQKVHSVSLYSTF